mmetsp:Transcript_22143/g.27032  ORF Transcript_22143/g.27032 Transcript_22143/m.27032 type:complete len:157 (-) Transcript_22143:1100-1570(-)
MNIIFHNTSEFSMIHLVVNSVLSACRKRKLILKSNITCELLFCLHQRRKYGNSLRRILATTSRDMVLVLTSCLCSRDANPCENKTPLVDILSRFRPSWSSSAFLYLSSRQSKSKPKADTKKEALKALSIARFFLVENIPSLARSQEFEYHVSSMKS